MSSWENRGSPCAARHVSIAIKRLLLLSEAKLFPRGSQEYAQSFKSKTDCVSKGCWLADTGRCDVAVVSCLLMPPHLYLLCPAAAVPTSSNTNRLFDHFFEREKAKLPGFDNHVQGPF